MPAPPNDSGKHLAQRVKSAEKKVGWQSRKLPEKNRE